VAWHQGAIANTFEHDGIVREDSIEPFGFGIARGHGGHDAVAPGGSQGTPKEQNAEVHCDSSHEHPLGRERPGKKGLERPGSHRDSASGTPQIRLEEKAGCQLNKGKVKEEYDESSQGN
jgi:hypothetical protein